MNWVFVNSNSLNIKQSVCQSSLLVFIY